MSHPPAELYWDEGYLRELDHRSRVLHGRPVDCAWLLRPKPRGYLEAMGAVGGAIRLRSRAEAVAVRVTGRPGMGGRQNRIRSISSSVT